MSDASVIGGEGGGVPRMLSEQRRCPKFDIKLVV